MDIKGLRFFLGVLRYKSITKASEHLYIAQPALGLQIRKLETELGVQLFQRHSRGVTPTEAGLLLAEHAEVILRQVERTRQDLQDYSKAPRGRVTIGLSPTTSQLLATKLADRVREKFPEVVLSVCEGLSEQLMEWVEKEKVDLAMTYNPNASGDIEVERLALEVLHFIRPPGDQRAGPIALADVLKTPLVLPSRPHLLRLLVEDAARSIGAEATVAYEVDSVQMIRDFVKRGFGNTILPLGAVSAALRAGTLRADQIVRPEIERTLYLAYSHDRPPSKAFLSVADTLREITADLIDGGVAGWRGAVPELRASA